MSKDETTNEAPAKERGRRATDPRIHARRVEVARQHGRRRRWKILAALTVIGLVAGGFEMLHSSVLGARHVRVVGAANISRNAIIGIAGLTKAPPLVDLDTAIIARRVERLPWVLDAVVSVAWPTTVNIKVTERTPVAVLADPGTGGTWAVIDQFGRVLEQVESRPTSLPVIASQVGSAADGKTYAPGDYVSASLDELAQVAAGLPESMVPETSEITISTDGIVVEMPGHPLAIVGNPSSLQQKFVSLATVLARTDLNGVSAIDLRVPAAPVLLDKPSSPIVAGHVGG